MLTVRLITERQMTAQPKRDFGVLDISIELASSKESTSDGRLGA